jgi:uncharacterized repeat protein (TIGR01451 family)
MFVLLIVLAMLITGLPQMSLADSGAYSIKLFASDPSPDKGSYLQTYEKLSPFELAPYTSGRGSNVLEHAVLYGPTAETRDGVTSLEPSDLEVGQIVPYQVRINVDGSVQPENGTLHFEAAWDTKTTSGFNFGFDPDYGVYSAFVDYGDVGSIDPAANATVAVTDYIENAGTSNERIIGDFTVSGLDDGDQIIVEIWTVLKNEMPPNPTGNVHAEIINSSTGDSTSLQSFSTGNQDIPLKSLDKIRCAQADISISKSDLPDPVYAGDMLTYNISVKNNSQHFVAHGVQVSDLLDPNLDFVSANLGGLFSVLGVNWPQMSLLPLETVNLSVTVMVRNSTPDIWPGSTADDRGGREFPTGGIPDITNIVLIASTITPDPDPLNNVWFEPTNVLKRTTDIVVTKTWNDSYDDQENYFGLRPTSIMAQLLQNGQPYGSMFEINAADGWSKTITNLPLNDEGGSPYTYTVKEESDNSAYNTSEDGLIIVNSLRRTEVEVVKQWDDFDDTYGYRPDTVLVELLQNGVPTGIRETLSEQNNWRYTFAGLPERNNNGQLFVYTVTELDVPDRYVSTVGEDGLTITNTLKTGEITVNKLAGTATNLTDEVFFVKLVKADDTNKFWIKPFTVSSPAVFDDLPFGTYNISEVADASGTPISSLFEYYVNIHDSQLTINDQNPELATDIENTIKTGSITISKLAAQGTAISGVNFYVKLTSVDDPTKSWIKAFQTGAGNEAVFTDLDLGSYIYEEVGDMLGTPLTDSSAYIATINDTELTITPDSLNAYGSVTNEVKTGSITINKLPGNDTILASEDVFYVRLTGITNQYDMIKSFTTAAPAVFENVPLGSYTATEVLDAQGTALPGNFRYEVTVDKATLTVAPAALNDSATITNTLKRTDVAGSKVWEDQDDFFGLRPDSIEVDLYQNSGTEPFRSITVTNTDVDPENDNIWHFKFEDLPEYDENNVAYIYTLGEQPLVSIDYEPNVDGNTITNTLLTVPIRVLKLDDRDAETPLAGAVFELWTAVPTENGGQLIPRGSIPGTFEPGMKLETITTGSDGYATTNGAYPAGEYFLVEVQAPTGFYLVDPIRISLTSGTVIELAGQPFELTVYNEFINLPSIGLAKTVANLTRGTTQADEATAEAGETARYQVVITNDGNANLVDVIFFDDQAYDGQMVTDNDDNTYTFAEDEGGRMYIDLPNMAAGETITLTYDYLTTAADADRSPIINTARVEAQMIETPDYPSGWQGYAEDTATLTVEQITSQIELLKLDARDGETPLAGAVFELWTAIPAEDDMQMNLIPQMVIPGTMIPGIKLEEMTTGEDGKALSGDYYPAGFYFLLETKAPEGFHLMTEPILFQMMPDVIIQLEGTPFSLTAYNNFIFEPDITLTKTVANLTDGTSQGESAELDIGEIAGYEVIITNNGNIRLDNVVFFDSEAVVDMIATDQDDNDYTFLEDTEGNAYIELGPMDSEQVFILTYNYTAIADDVDRSPIVNTAAAEAEILPLLFATDYENGLDEDIPFNPYYEGWSKRVEDTAEITVIAPPPETTTTLPTIIVTTTSIPLAEPTTTTAPTTIQTIDIIEEEIPKSGEDAPLWPLGLALIGIAGGLVLILHKSKKNQLTENKSPDEDGD